MLLALLSSTYAQWGQRHLLVLQSLESCKTIAQLDSSYDRYPELKGKKNESRKSGQCDWLNEACSEVAANVIGLEWSKNIESRIPPSRELKFL
jgi:hypothetical protein